MTQAADEAGTKEVLHDVTICGITIQARPIDEKLYTSMLVRLQVADLRGSEQAASNAMVKVVANTLARLVPDEEQIDDLIDLIGTDQITPDELVRQICMAGANREERRRAARDSTATREPAARHGGGRPRSGRGRPR